VNSTQESQCLKGTAPFSTAIKFFKVAICDLETELEKGIVYFREYSRSQIVTLKEKRGCPLYVQGVLLKPMASGIFQKNPASR